MNYSTADIRQFLTGALSDEEIETICFDYFPEVHDNFAASMPKGQKIQLLLEHCKKRQCFPNLMAALEKTRKEQYQARFASVEIPTVLPKLRHDLRQIFISHAHQDTGLARRLATDLRARGWQVWIALDSIRPGEKWIEAIQRGLDESGVFVVLLTPPAIDSDWVKNETNAAVELEHQSKLRFIPLYVQSCEVPSLWAGYQHVSFLNSYETGLETLLQELVSPTWSVKRDLALPPEPTGPPERWETPSLRSEPRRVTREVWLIPLMLTIIAATAGMIDTTGLYLQLPGALVMIIESVAAVALFVWVWTYVAPRQVIRLDAKTLGFWLIPFVLLLVFWLVALTVFSVEEVPRFFGVEDMRGFFGREQLLVGCSLVCPTSVLLSLLAWLVTLGARRIRRRA